MNINKQPVAARRFIAVGLLMTILPLLFKEYIHVPDFFRGLLAGTGLGFELIGLVIINKSRVKSGACKAQEPEM